MEGGAVDALLLTGENSLRSVELRLRSYQLLQSMVSGGIIPDESRTEGAREQRRAVCSSSRQ